MADIKEFTIDRSRWRRGCGPGVGLLRDVVGGQCCLGFFGEACGVPAEKLLNNPYPVGIARNSPLSDEHWPSWLFALDDQDYEHRDRLANDNDRVNLSEPKREAMIAARFAAHGVTVHFVDGDKP